ncbi:death-associated protein kinase 1-like isoform X2 [Atheta coriaria]|uniref:death-associated protein kinase 1-like isoform X2 n=1 Tax=Dalotia coriaria TaxID=877792 RepID=UPI0031F442C5
MDDPLSRGSSFSPSESFELTALQYACKKGVLEEVKYLIDSGAELDTGPDPALHLALRKGYSSIALTLLQAGAEYEVRDSHGDYPIHIACSHGLLSIVHTLCTLGCNVEVQTIKGLFPLHLAAKYGHIQIVRCLCSSGCNIDVKNADNIRADITALKYGHNDIAELLDRLRATGNRDLYARQLVPTSKPAIRLSLRLLGNCAAGKTSLFKSLGAGLFSALFRRSSSLQSNKSRPSSPLHTHIEMDLTSRQNSLNFESSGNHNCTNGISVQNVDISNVGIVTVWEFSGQENYFPTYHNFLYPNPYSMTAILFNLEEPPSVQVKQVSFWLNFLCARQQADLPTCEYGKIILIATHVDATRSVKNQQGEWISSDAQKTTETIMKLFPHVSNLSKDTIVMDCNVPASYAFKQLKTLLCAIKQDCIRQTIGSWTGLLEASLLWLATLQKQYEQFPVLNRKTFSALLRTQVNLLTSDEHIYELLQQLHAMGEVHCVHNLIVLNVNWLGSNLIGELLSMRFLEHARVTGVYTAEDFQACFNQCDAIAVLELLEALDLCIPCEVEEDIEYEFPMYNLTETLAGLWDPDDPRYANDDCCYGGVRFRTAPNVLHIFNAVFCYIQVEMRKLALEYSDSDIDLYQWFKGSKFCTVSLETLVTLVEDDDGDEYIEVKIRGPRQSSKYCFYFFEQIIATISQAIYNVCPGVLYERRILSTNQLRAHDNNVHEYDAHIVTSAMLESESILDVAFRNQITDQQESLVQLVLFDNPDLICNIQWGCALKVNELPAPVKLKLCGMLDPPESHGRDWCLLALRLGLSQERIAALDTQHTSCTMRLLSIANCTIGALVSSLYEIDRKDAAMAVLQLSPIHKIIASDEPL